MFICGIIFDVKPNKISVIKRIPNIGNATPSPTEKICPVIITLVITLVLKKYVEKSFKKAQKHFTGLSEYVQESTDAIRTTKAYSGETNQLKKFIKKNKLLKMSSFNIIQKK